MNQYFITTARLKALILGRVAAITEIRDMDTQVDLLELALTPDGGWPGKNPEERKYAKEYSLTHDAVLEKLNKDRQAKRDALAIMEAEIENCHLDLKALEWGIRDQSNVVLGGRSIFDEMDDNTPEVGKITAGLQETTLTPEDHGTIMVEFPEPDPDPTEEAAEAVSKWAKADPLHEIPADSGYQPGPDVKGDPGFWQMQAGQENNDEVPF